MEYMEFIATDEQSTCVNLYEDLRADVTFFTQLRSIFLMRVIMLSQWRRDESRNRETGGKMRGTMQA